MADYTDPELRERLKEEITAGDRGGRPGQWSARKAQLLTQEYEKAGGGYVGEKDERQRHLEQWGEEDWKTKEGDAGARKGDKTRRYLPEKAWELLTPKEREATDERKKSGGEQHVGNTDAAKAARKVKDLDELKADEAARFVRGLDSKAELDKARKAEERGKGRKTVLEAIAARRDQV